MTDRDPRRDPRPGDVLQKAGMVLKVTGREGNLVHYDLTQPGKGPVYALAMNCSAGLGFWKRFGVAAEVVHKAEEPTK